MAESPPPPATARSRRWGRRLGWTALGLGVVLSGIGVAAWTTRVELVHYLVNSGESVWQVQIGTIEWQENSLEVTGLQVTHPDQKEAVFKAGRVRVPADWKALQQGRLGAVTVTDPEVYWRDGLRSDPPSPRDPERRGPMVSWDSITLTGGKVDVASAGAWQFRGLVEGSGGPGAWHYGGHLAQSPATLTITGPSYAQEFPETPVTRVAAQAESVTLTAAVEAESGLLTIPRSRLRGTSVELVLRPAGSEPVPVVVPTPSAETPAALPSSPGLVSAVQLGDLAAPQLRLQAALPWPLAATGDLTLGGLQAGSGHAFGMSGIGLGSATASLPAGTKVGSFELAGDYRTDGLRLQRGSFSGVEVPDLKALLQGTGLTVPAALAASFKAGGEARDLQIHEGRISSAAVQSLTLDTVDFRLPDQAEGSVKTLVLEAVPDEILPDRRFRRLEVENPVADLQFSLPSRRPASEALTPATVPAAPGAAAPVAERPIWEGWTADTLKVAGGQVAVTLPQTGGARVSSGVAVETTTHGNPGTPPDYQITLAQPRLSHPALPDQPVALAAAIQLTASAAGLWQKREIDRLTLTGSRLQIGEALFRLVNALPPRPVAPEPPPPPATSSAVPEAPPWRLKHLVLGDALIQLEHLGDGRRLEVPVKQQEFHDLPLNADALAQVDRLYKIEVPNITLYSPFSDGQKVAVLDTNYIQFTPSGLLSRRLERVDLIAPSLYAGQPLFEFVQAARKRFTELAAAPAAPAGEQVPMLVDNSPRSPTVISALATVTPASAAAAAEWDIPFYTESGKVFVAPKGYPWPNLPVIPFRNARDAKGQPVPFLLHGESFHGELAIAPGWYDFPEYKVRLRLSDRGRIIFNTPQKDRDNNLTEVFENNTLIFRQLRVDEAWLSITYDARGIYARFGGLTCGGTLTGGINLYLDELYTWDAWASLIGIGMKPLTDKLTPDTFQMTGPVDELTVNAYGDTTTLYQASLALKVSRPGRLHILALDSMKDKIDSLGGLKADLGQIGLATLRDFDYTSCTGSLKLFGSEGQGQLALAGPAGSRTFNLKLHDYRAKTPRSSAPF